MRKGGRRLMASRMKSCQLAKEKIKLCEEKQVNTVGIIVEEKQGEKRGRGRRRKNKEVNPVGISVEEKPGEKRGRGWRRKNKEVNTVGISVEEKQDSCLLEKEKIESLCEDSHEPEKPRKVQKRKNGVVNSENTVGVSVEEEQCAMGDAPKKSRGRKRRKKEAVEEVDRSRRKIEEDGKEVVANTCHQCARNDKGRVVRCTKCNAKRFCVPCMTK